MLEQARDIVLLVGADAKILYANQAATVPTDIRNRSY